MYRRTVDGELLDFGTTGALRDSNLLMYDRQTETWWQEVGGEGVIGRYAGRRLEQLYLSIVSWADFKATFPDGQVLSRPDSGRPAAIPMAMTGRAVHRSCSSGEEDPRLPAVERVVAIERGSAAWAVSFTVAEERVVVGVRWRRGRWTPGTARRWTRDGGGTWAGIFSPVGPDGETLTFADAGGGRANGQRGGRAVSGPLAGTELTPVAGRIGQFWFSWAVYRPDTVVYGGGS